METISDVLDNKKILNFITKEMKSRGFTGVKINRSKKSQSVYLTYYNESLIRFDRNSFYTKIKNDAVGDEYLVKNRLGYIIRISDHPNVSDRKIKKVGINIVITPEYYEIWEQENLIAKGD